MNDNEIRRYLAVIKRAVGYIENMLDNNDGGLLEQLVQQPEPKTIVEPVLPKTTVEPVTPPEPVVDHAKLAQIREDRKKHIQSLVDIDCWPEAIPAHFVNKTLSNEDQANRANAVLDMMLEPNTEGKTFLDFGCGEGWIAQEILKRGVVESYGYDINVDPNWNKRKGATFVADYGDLPKKYFDIVMLYDVLDHCDDPIDVMSKIKSIMKPEGRIYIRCHPWTSRHGTHLWKQGINRAYWHLFLCWEEIKEMINKEPIFTRIEKNPKTAYNWWFHDFRIRKERPIIEPVSEFFRVQSFKELLANEQQIPLSEIDQFLNNMETQFIDYSLSNE